MTARRTTALKLAALDVAVSVIVFNLIAAFRGISLGDSLLVKPLFAPIVALVFAIYLIDGYKTRTDMLSVDYASQHAIALFGAMIATLLLAYVFLKPPYELQSSRLVIILSFIVLIPLTLGYR